MTVLAGDIGGTKTNLALFKEGKESDFKSYPSQEAPNLKSIVSDYLSQVREKIDIACFAIAGPVHQGRVKTTNLPWVVDAKDLSDTLKIEHVHLINDLEANAYSIEVLSNKNILELYHGAESATGHRAVVSPGTGLGEAGLYWDGVKHHPFASEGGHCEFGPRDELQIDLCRYLYKRFGHASYERVLSGPGLHNIFEFYREEMKREAPPWLLEEMQSEDPSRVITENALSKKADLCVDSLNLFASILGSECSNMALKFMALGGIYLGGGIPPKILPVLKESHFRKGFLDKGRFQGLLEGIPVRVILDDKASLKGAAHCAEGLLVLNRQ